MVDWEVELTRCHALSGNAIIELRNQVRIVRLLFIVTQEWLVQIEKLDFEVLIEKSALHLHSLVIFLDRISKFSAESFVGLVCILAIKMVLLLIALLFAEHGVDRFNGYRGR